MTQEFKYYSKDIFIVKHSDCGSIIKIFGIKSAAKDFIKENKINNPEEKLHIDTWPVEFKKKRKLAEV